MHMKKRCMSARSALVVASAVLASALLLPVRSAAQVQSTSPQKPAPQVVVFYEQGFPASDSPAPTAQQIMAALPQAQVVSAAQLPEALANAGTRLLVLPYGSSYPESAWPAIHNYLQRGGNLLVLGGRPFLRAAYQANGSWKLRDESVRVTRLLYINDYWQMPGSAGLEYAANPELPLGLPQFEWKQAFSPIIHLSVRDLFPREGSAGSIDARLDPLVWGDNNSTHMAAPAIQIDHLQYAYPGSRWIFLNCELPDDFYASPKAATLIGKLAAQAERGSEDLHVRPRVPLFLPGEPLSLHLSTWAANPLQNAKVTITVTSEDTPGDKQAKTFAATETGELVMPAVQSKGFHVVEAKFYEGNVLRRVYHSGFWIRDEQYLRSGPRLTVKEDHFEVDGKPVAVMGTTYMSSEVQREYFAEPNAYVWDRDLGQIAGGGLNMIRTGWWTGWSQIVNGNAELTDDSLRTLEALLMTARKHNLPVQLNFFAFVPEVLGGEDPYFDPVALKRQQRFVLSVVQRFKDVPYLAYDLINEPSFSKKTWRTRPNGDEYELAAWNQWLQKRYPDRAALLAAWNMPPQTGDGPLPVPSEEEFNIRSQYEGQNSLKLFDFYLFAQDSFTRWVHDLAQAIRSTGSKQLITVGQDEGGISERLNPAYFGGEVDFTTTHSWWQNQALLWDSLLAKQPGKPMLVQETGLQRELTLDERQRRRLQSEAALFERKLALSFVQGSGAIEWLWNVNAYMTAGNEVPIGAVAADASLKPEGQVLQKMAAFARELGPWLHGMQTPQVAIVTSQAMQYSVLNPAASLAQQNAVRALGYHARIPAYIIAANQIANLGRPKLVILPSPQALTDATWNGLLNYVKAGGTLLISGPISRDEHWHEVDRLSQIGITDKAEPLTFSQCSMQVGDQKVDLHYDLNAQNLLEWLPISGKPAIREVKVGQGNLVIASCPMELTQDFDSMAAVYRYAAGLAGVTAEFAVHSPLSSSVLVYPQKLQDSTLYIFESEGAVDEKVDVEDAATKARMTFTLPAQRAALAVIGKDGKLVAKYGY
jgi:hypothetical protein